MNKTRVTYTLDKEVIDKLRELSKKTMIPMSRLVEQAILDTVKKNKKEGK